MKAFCSLAGNDQFALIQLFCGVSGLKRLSSAQAKELAQIETKFAAARKAYQVGLDAILVMVNGIDQSQAVRLSGRAWTDEQVRGVQSKEQAAVLQYLVRPDRLNIILTTHDKRVSHIITQWKDEPFREVRMNKMIADLHDDFSDPDRNPLPRSRELSRRTFRMLVIGSSNGFQALRHWKP